MDKETANQKLKDAGHTQNSFDAISVTNLRELFAHAEPSVVVNALGRLNNNKEFTRALNALASDPQKLDDPYFRNAIRSLFNTLVEKDDCGAVRALINSGLNRFESPIYPLTMHKAFSKHRGDSDVKKSIKNPLFPSDMTLYLLAAGGHLKYISQLITVLIRLLALGLNFWLKKLTGLI